MIVGAGHIHGAARQHMRLDGDGQILEHNLLLLIIGKAAPAEPRAAVEPPPGAAQHFHLPPGAGIGRGACQLLQHARGRLLLRGAGHCRQRADAAHAVLLILTDVIEQHKVGLFPVRRRREILQHARFHPIVRIDKGQVLPARLPHAPVARVAQAAVGLVDHAHTRIAFIAAAQCEGTVCGSVVHKQKLEIRECLAQKAFHALVQIPLHIVDRHNHTYFGQCSTPLSSVSPYASGAASFPSL